MERNSLILAKLIKGMKVEVDHYCAFHDVSKAGRITAVNIPFRFIKLENEKIFFDDIYDIRIIDNGIE